MTRADEPAFPLQDAGVSKINACAGLTKREYFAAMAMQGLLSNWEWMRGLDRTCLKREVSMEFGVAMASMSYADALLAALEKRE